MLRFPDVSRKLSTTYRIFHDEGVTGVTHFLRWRLDYEMRLHAVRKVKSVTLDGCTVNVQGLPDSETKIDLAKEDYEVAERHLVPKYLDRTLPVIELGGCIGVIACITNRLLVSPDLHVVVEANPLAIPLLTETRDSNQCKFQILNQALAYDAPSVTFRPTLNLLANSVQRKTGEEPVTVPATALRDIVKERKFDSFNLICDIEGSEWDLVMNEGDVLQKASTISLETHARFIGEDRNAQLLSKLGELGFQIVDQEATVVVLKQSQVSN